MKNTKKYKKLFKKKIKISKQIMRTKCMKKIVVLKSEYEILENKIKVSKENKRLKEEEYVIEEIKSNPKVFY